MNAHETLIKLKKISSIVSEALIQFVDTDLTINPQKSSLLPMYGGTFHLHMCTDEGDFINIDHIPSNIIENLLVDKTKTEEIINWYHGKMVDAELTSNARRLISAIGVIRQSGISEDQINDLINGGRLDITKIKNLMGGSK